MKRKGKGGNELEVGVVSEQEEEEEERRRRKS
jgi:hypothetical protein